MNHAKRILAKYDYAFPKSAIAQNPAHPRDSAKLLVYERDTKEIRYGTFRAVGNFLSSRAVLVLNNTKVIPAKIIFTKKTGGKVPGLYLSHTNHHVIVLLARHMPMGGKLTLGPHTFAVVGKAKKEYFLRPSFDRVAPTLSSQKVRHEVGHQAFWDSESCSQTKLQKSSLFISLNLKKKKNAVRVSAQRERKD